MEISTKEVLSQFANMRDWLKPIYEHNDIAHQIDHIDTVVNNVIDICQRIPVEPAEMTCAIIAAYYHDICCQDSREFHHSLAAITVHREWFHLVALLPKRLHASYLHNYDYCKLIANACFEHRASFKGLYTSVVSEIVACADRGRPVTDATLYRRSYLYGRCNAALNHDDACKYAIEHIRDKYGNKGYVKYPELYMTLYADELAEQRAWVERATMKDIAEVAETWRVGFEK